MGNGILKNVILASKMNRIIFGIGSNLGDRSLNLEKACAFLTQKLDLKNVKKSQIFENKALLKPDSPKEWDLDFFNIAFSADIDLEKFSPEKILEIIKNIEKEMGRKDLKIWAPREIDIDILAIDDLILDLAQKLQIPHKEIENRDFFQKTLKEIEPSWKNPRIYDK
jgi:2-amino-4-hydroxy-6-hydroxymethyldihydropteridine diphosphokinase